ncbi:histidinol-phosphate aminotransferase, partial [Staphylococcus pseudintermedius]
PGLSPEKLKVKYGNERELHKHASNENFFGRSLIDKQAIIYHVVDLFVYP